MKKKHIDDVQTFTVDEHFKLIMEDDSINDSKLNLTFNDLPHWYDKQLFKEAQNYSNRSLSGIFIANLIGLIAVFSITPILKVLMYTKQSSVPCAAFRRYVQTHLHIQQLYTSDVNNPHSNWYKSINAIRLKHAKSNKKSQNAGIGPIYQRDMVLTQFGFLAYIIMMPKSFGLRNKPAEEEAINHFWRVIGYMLGIPDKLNLCRKTAMETRKLCQKIFKDVIIVNLNKWPSDFHSVSSTVINSLWYVDFNMNEDSILTLFYRMHGMEYRKRLGWYSWLHIKYYDGMCKLFLTPYIGNILRTCMNCFLKVNNFLMENFPILAWIKYGKENATINLYPRYEQF